MKLQALFFSLILFATSAATAQNVTKPAETGPTYIGAFRTIDKFDGSVALSQDYAGYGISVGTYDDDPERIVTSLVVMTYSSGTYTEINPNSKLILKVNGENMILTTPNGTQWVGAHDSFVGSAGVAGAIVGVKQVVYYAKALYPITGEQLEALLQYGFSKYRFQYVGGVNEGEFSERKQKKLTRKLNENYQEVRDEQAEIHKKTYDLSDF